MAGKKKAAAKKSSSSKSADDLVATVNRPTLARLLDKSLKTVDSWRRRGLPCDTSGPSPSFVVAEVVEWLRERDVEAAIASGKRSDGAISLQDLQKRKALADTELAELALEEARGEVIPRDVALEEFGDSLTRIRSKILAIPSRYAGRLAKLSTVPKMKAALREASFEILDELASADGITGDAASAGKISSRVRRAPSTRPRGVPKRKAKAST